jgi:hypothetical protein
MQILDKIIDDVLNYLGFYTDEVLIIILVIAGMGLLIWICWATIVDLRRSHATGRVRRKFKNQVPQRQPPRDGRK